jgi:murein L,D-transpeptidase YcbB/YkuD
MPASPAPSQVNALAQSIQSALLTPGAGLGFYDLDLETLRKFYAGRKYMPAWSSDPASKRNADIAIVELGRAGEDGLDEGDYRLDAIRNKSHSSAEFDLLLTAGILSYMHDLRVGRVLPAAVGRDIELPTVNFDTVAALSDALSNGTMLTLTADLAPPHAEYASLKRALARYRDIDRNGGWPLIEGAPAGKLSAGDPRLEILRRRLAAEDAALGAQSESVSVEELTGALTRFQARNGLEADGKLGKRTLAALNTTAAQRISQIVANMERWRWLPRPFEQRYIEVNAADATLKAVDRSDVILTSRIVAGKPSTPTPIFAAMVTAVTINPYWNIPSAIARKELLPKERRHPGYLASQHISFDGPNGTLRQQPGADNSLGRVKLEMPNRFNAYLHDTPARALFARTDRHFSHGCMRVEQIQPLASWALTGDVGAALDHIAAAITAGDNVRISLDNPLPVYVLYWTAIANPDGTVEIRPDVYGRDTRLLAALAGQHVVGRSAMNTSCPVSSAG